MFFVLVVDHFPALEFQSTTNGSTSRCGPMEEDVIGFGERHGYHCITKASLRGEKKFVPSLGGVVFLHIDHVQN